METKHKSFKRFLLVSILAGCLISYLCGKGASSLSAQTTDEPKDVTAAVITCKGMIDDGLFKSIKRRSDQAIAAGASYIILEVSTYGGLVKSADDIYKLFMQDLNNKVKTVAFVDTEAISAGALVSVACNDIIMRPTTKIGDCAPIMMGGKLEGVEREKSESFIRASFRNAAEANGYPSPLLEAMVTQAIEVHRVYNKETKSYEFFKKDDLPKDEKKYNLEDTEIVVKDTELLTLTAFDAVKFGVARTEADSIDAALDFLAERDGVKISRPPTRYETNWSEQLVRWVSSPAVMSVLVLLAMLGAYVELNSPGIGLPGLVAVICVVVIVGSKFLIGMANWVEIAIFFAGIALLAIEIFIIPGFGIAGALGIVFVLAGLFGMLVRNAPSEIPWPTTDFDWDILAQSLIGLFAAFAVFFVLAWMLAKYLPKSRFMAGLMLKPAFSQDDVPSRISMTTTAHNKELLLEIGERGVVSSPLRPAGKAQFESIIADVVAQAEFLEKGTEVEVIEIHGNRVVIKKVE